MRRTRSFIQDNYAETDPDDRPEVPDASRTATRSYFPTRVPKTVKFPDRRARPDRSSTPASTAPAVVDAINQLTLPRYGLGNYLAPSPHQAAHAGRSRPDTGRLSRAGKRLMGFCRTNLFKRLESSGQAFLQSVERHILRNYVFLHAIENGLPLPLGTQDAELLDTATHDEDADAGRAEPLRRRGGR